MARKSKLADAAYYREYRKTPSGHRQMTMHNAKTRAKKAGVLFALTNANYSPPPEKCPCCGVPMVLGTGGWDVPTLGRVVPEDGYSVENCIWLCKRCNTLKSNVVPGTLGDLYVLADFLYHLYRKRGMSCPTRLRPLLSPCGEEAPGGATGSQADEGCPPRSAKQITRTKKEREHD